MQESDYKITPPIHGPNDLLTFLRAIPAKYWCVDMRDDYNGHHCVLGHIDNAYGYQGNRGVDGFTAIELATANNGTIGTCHGPRKPGAKTTGLAAKTRVLNLIRRRIAATT